MTSPRPVPVKAGGPDDKFERLGFNELIAAKLVQPVTVVKAGRGKRLKETPEMFSGLFWSGQQAIEVKHYLVTLYDLGLMKS